MSKDTDIKCPVCGNPILEKNHAFSCSNDTCKFYIFKHISGTEVTTEMVKEIVENGQTSKPYNFTGKKGDKFKAYLAFDANKKSAKFVFG